MKKMIKIVAWVVMLASGCWVWIKTRCGLRVGRLIFLEPATRNTQRVTQYFAKENP